MAPVPFTTLQALLTRLQKQQADLVRVLPDHPHLSSGGGLVGKPAPTEDKNVFRVARRLEQVVNAVHATFPNERAWRTADEFDSAIYAFLKRGLVPSFQSAVVVKLDELDKALCGFRDDPNGTTYHAAVRMSSTDS